MIKRISLVLVLCITLGLSTGCLGVSVQVTPPPPLFATPTPARLQTTMGTIVDISLSARVISLSQSSNGVESIAVDESTQIADAEGHPLTLTDLRPGQTIIAVGTINGKEMLANQITLQGSEPTAEPTPQSAEPPTSPSTEGWKSYLSTSLQLNLLYPPTWNAVEQGATLYLFSDQTTAEGAKYYVYIDVYPDPSGTPLVDLIAKLWDEQIAQQAQFVERTVGGIAAHVTTDIPSAYGALTVFLEGQERYISISLTPYDPSKRTEQQETLESIFWQIVEFIALSEQSL